jgi:hypothetical protein
MQVLLEICEDWSLANGIRFQPAKCYILGQEDRNDSGFAIYNQALPVRKQIDYLGLPFTANRINHTANIEKRTQKARNVAASLARHGMNIAGFSQSASSILYKTFIRPVMEYGLQLTLVTDRNLKLLQKAQNFALRLIFSAPCKTSTNALQKLLLIEPMDVRNQVLNIKFAARIHNSTDKDIPAVRFWRHAFPQQYPGSISKITRGNPLFSHATFKPILGNPLAVGLCKPTPAFKSMDLKALLKDKIAQLDHGNTNVAGTIRVNPSKNHRHVLRPFAFKSPMVRVPILRWLVGNVAVHRPCDHCDAEISRKHAVECSGADQALIDAYPYLLPQFDAEVDGTFLDFLLNKFAYPRKPAFDLPEELYENISAAIGVIYHHCLGYRQQDNGFYALPQASQSSQNQSQDQASGETFDPG